MTMQDMVRVPKASKGWLRVSGSARLLLETEAFLPQDLEEIMVFNLGALPPPTAPTSPNTITLGGHMDIPDDRSAGPRVTVNWGAGGQYHGTGNELVNVITQTGCFANVRVRTSRDFPLDEGSADDDHGTPLGIINQPGTYVADQLFLGNGNVIQNSGFRITRTVTPSPVAGHTWQLTVTITPMAVANVPFRGAALNAAAGQGVAVNWVRRL
jgi:hypothetical protein